jgi:hypothetical protein
MRSHVRISLLAPLVGAILALAAVSAPAAQAAFGVEKFSAANCKAAYEGCAGEKLTFGPLEYWFPKETTEGEEKVQGYTQAAGHPSWGITDFKVSTVGTFPNEAPTGIVKHVRTDVGPGVSTNPEAMAQCSMEEFGNKEAIPNTGFYPKPACAEAGPKDTVIGVNYVTIYAGPGGVSKSPEISDLPLKGTAYNVTPAEHWASDFGVALELPIELTGAKLKQGFKEAEEAGAKPGVGGFPSLLEQKFLEEQQYYAHTMINGNVEWAGNYHDYYEIDVSTALPLISSRLVLKGDIGNTEKGGYITLPSNCAGPGPATTSTVTLESAEGATGARQYVTPLGTEGCKGEPGFLIPPFAPEFTLKPETKQSDSPDGITTELQIPHDPSPTGIDTSQVKTTIATLPEGMTLNPSASAEVTESCTPAQARITSSTFGVACPAKSKIGTDIIEVPTLPAKSLEGNMYLGGPEGGGKITGPPYTVYLNAESTRYGVDVRVKGTVTPDETTGRLTATFEELPEQPFTNAILKFNGGSLAPLANPLVCGTATTNTSFVPYIGSFATKSPSAAFAVDSNNSGGACPSPLPFSLSQSTVNQAPGNAGAATSYTVSIDRGEGQQYISQVKTVMPAGLVGLIPSVTQCGEPQAGKGECPSASQIGVVGVTAGAGPTPYAFSGPVYLTGPYGGAPFGLSIVVPAVAGPFNLGNVVTRGTLNVEPYTARVVATSNLPMIVKGIPLRLRHIAVNINKQGFLHNPTYCGKLSTDTTLSGFTTLGVAGSATQTLSTPFQVSNCNKLAYKPKFGAASGAKTSKANGASLETTLNIPTGDANTKSVLVQLPTRLPSRLSTLQKACPEKTFASDPYHCPSGSFVGGVRANTPTLAAKLKGPAILVSHGGEAFPDLDLLLEGEGVRVILVGNTKITKGVTTTNFANTPDVPVSSITVNLPVGPHSALAANGDLCKSKLVMPTTIVAQNGVKVKQNTTIKVTNCPVQVVGKKTIGNVAYLTVRTSSAGRISGKGSGLANTFRKLKQAQKSASLKVPLTGAGRSRGRPFKVKVRVGFVPSKKGAPTSVAYTTVTFG